MDAESKVKIRWDGPPQQVCYAVAEFGYKAALDPGATYEVSEALAESLLRSSKDWSLVADSGPARRRTDLDSVPGRNETSSSGHFRNTETAVA